MKIGFLFNHDAPHQVAHTAPILAELAADGADITVLTSSAEQAAQVHRALPAGNPGVGNIRFVALSVGPVAGALDRAARWVVPFRRIAMLRQNLPAFAALDALVVPETTSALLRTRFGLDRLKLIYLPHGAGDRSVGFRKVVRQFDLVLLSGGKVRDRMLSAGLITARSHAVIGYPKFDAIDPQARPRFFDDDRPVVLYNPHFDPLLSSWYDAGIEVLDWFAGQRKFNLIFAPHVMLFRRRVHASVEHRRLRRRRELPARLLGLPHMRIDTGSSRSIDMSYTLAADIYLGDASSQVYEWLLRPRPCIFLDTHGARWRDDPSYAHWHLGETITGVAALPAALDRAVSAPGAYAARQIEARERTFAGSETPSARRAADAITAFLAQAGNGTMRPSSSSQSA